MRICFLAPANNYHTKKWCEYFISKGHEVHVISLVKGDIDHVYVHYIESGASATDSDIKKIKYLLSVKRIKKLVSDINPDIINAHYATSYGMIAALCKFNYILSVWGNDVYKFPNKSFIHKLYFKYVIKKSKYIFSTSKVMANELKKYTTKKIYITPFGVKMDLFNSDKNDNRYKGYFTVGTVKSLKEKYGIKHIIEAASIVKKDIPNIKVVIGGDGVLLDNLKELSSKLDLDVSFLGNITQEEASKLWANIDIAIVPSIDDSESFGVSVVEAQASGKPVIISDVKGLLESTSPKSRIVVKRGNSIDIAKAIKKLYKAKKLRSSLGSYGRKYVLENYEYEKCFSYIEELFYNIYNTSESSEYK